VLERHKFEQNETLRILKTHLELRISRLEDRVSNLDVAYTSRSVTNLVQGMHANLDEAYSKMQESFKEAKDELVQTGLDLASKLQCANIDSDTPSVSQAVADSIVLSLETKIAKISKEPILKVSCGPAVHSQKRQRSCPPILEENEGKVKEQQNRIDYLHLSQRAKADSVTFRKGGSLDLEIQDSKKEQRSAEIGSDTSKSTQGSLTSSPNLAYQRDSQIGESSFAHSSRTSLKHSYPESINSQTCTVPTSLRVPVLTSLGGK